MPPIEEGVAEDETVVGEETESTDVEFNPFEELQDDYKPSAIQKTTAADGMPTNTTTSRSTSIPVLSPETLVCMGDFSEFRTLGTNELVPVEDVIREGVTYRRKTDRFEVVPKRSPCKHYVRQAGSDDLLPDNIMHLRLCAARRTTEGTFMTVRDAAMWACSMREPRDFPSEEKYLDAFDQLKMEQGRERTQHTIFNKEEK